jgi:predicted nucleic acid-binding protein
VTAYVDSSVLLRLVLQQPGVLREWNSIARGIASPLVELECLRTLDRLRLRLRIADPEIARRRESVFRALDGMELVELGPMVLSRASQTLPTELGTLDAIHLASALLWRDTAGTDLAMATHDTALAVAARAFGLRVLGS